MLAEQLKQQMSVQIAQQLASMSDGEKSKALTALTDTLTAETAIIGFSSGLLGVLVTYLFCVPINVIIHRLTGIGGINAFLPAKTAVTLIIISMLLTLLSGIIPSKSAAKKDPVVALRTE